MASPFRGGAVEVEQLEGDGPAQPQPDCNAPRCAAVRQSPADALTAACCELSALYESAAVLSALPRLAISVCRGRAAQLLELPADGGAALLASAGASFVAGVEETHRHPAHVLATHHPEQRERGAIGAVSFPGASPRSRLLLAVEHEPGTDFFWQATRDLEVLALFACCAVSRASSREALRASQGLEQALVGAVRDAVIALDAKGVVRALSGTAATLIGVRAGEATGRSLRDLPGLSPLAAALTAGARCPDAVTLACGEVGLRLRRYDGGLAVTLSPRSSRAPAGGGGAHFHIVDLLGESPAIVHAREMARRVAEARLPILISGETGTGKEILAQAIHSSSLRAGEPFIGVNVPAVPRELLESEFFGYEPGAFTGATAHGHPGKFELAGDGTLLLDEIGDMPLEMQAKLLRVLQEREVYRLGGSRARPFKARVIASTNRDLDREVREGRFRLDLLMRLRVIHLRLPPLRERPGDVRLIVEHQLRVLAQATQRDAIRVTPEVMAVLERYSWPGNVRELVHVLECEASLLPANKDVIDAVPASIEGGDRPAASLGQEVVTLEDAEREACARALRKAGGNVARAARMLGVTKATLYRKLRRYGIAQG